MTLPLNPPVIVHHKAALDASPYPPNSLEAIRASLDAKARFIEIDVMALAADDYLLVHDPVLESETNGQGEVGGTSADAVRGLLIKHNDSVTAYRPPLLSEVISLFREYGGESRLQIDFKNVLPMRDEEPLHRLVRMIQPLGDRVLVSTGADWHLRRLRTLAGWLDLGFDIGFYLDTRTQPADPRLPPFRVGAYGYHDDHVLSALQMLDTEDYLAERCRILLSGIPSVSTWYVSHLLLAKCLDDGFNMAAWLHQAAIKLDAWTLDADNPVDIANLSRLHAAGVDQFTTNTPLALAALLRTPQKTSAQ